MNKHTPGPWFVSFPADGLATRHPVISCDGETQSNDEWEGGIARNIARAEWQGDIAKTNANARLIAAAPDMLRVMRELLAIASQHETRDCMTDAKSIIAFIES